jgi:hypothetical protein
LGRAKPNRVRSPKQMIGAKPLDQGPQHRGGNSRVSDAYDGKTSTYFGIYVAYSISIAYLSDLSDPIQSSSPFELVGRDGGFSVAHIPVGGVEDQEIELRPVFRRFTDVVGACIGCQARKLSLIASVLLCTKRKCTCV